MGAYYTDFFKIFGSKVDPSVASMMIVIPSAAENDSVSPSNDTANKMPNSGSSATKIPEILASTLFKPLFHNQNASQLQPMER